MSLQVHAKCSTSLVLVVVQLPMNRTVELWEGGAAAQIVYRLTQSPDRLCTQPNCRVYVEFEVEIGDYPRCRSGKPIVQAVLADNDDTCDDDTKDNKDSSGHTKTSDGQDTDDVNNDVSSDVSDDASNTSCSSRTEMDTDSTFFSRRVTVDNWNTVQTVSVAAKLDFKYDGTQVRQLGVWLRKVNEDGETIDRRSLAKFSVSCSLLSVES